jgi:hypothetical protein
MRLDCSCNYRALGMHAVKGTGCRYRKILRVCVYERSDLDAWACELLSGPALNSGSAHKEAKRKAARWAAQCLTEAETSCHGVAPPIANSVCNQ